MKSRVAVRFLGLAFLCAGSVLLVRAEDPPAADNPQTAALLKGAREMGEAFQAGDAAKIIDRTYPPIIEQMGGREKAAKIIGDGMKSMKAVVSDVEYKVNAPRPFQTEGKTTYAVVPTTLEMTLKDTGRIRAKGYLLGISEDQGKTWFYIDGTGMKSKKERQKTLPDVHEKLKLPDWERPEIVQKKDG